MSFNPIGRVYYQIQKILLDIIEMTNIPYLLRLTNMIRN